ncbi:hypothetical protein, unlikely [Trypanosoma brucei gambiense DAL972]|uniref:Uncharacterized protein n=1 Tax=Trypanosoma brucei gambiense (strain MHOM/CI/86/DAL972) TaxID=679716 RepID=D0A625_TRYB9|nr:hypothetical protein, unlikely [Trypanosoma brucei gambiense DAL972]CBH17126.1 hypothetical protein, unlikely [Trypanosoma brucei gambiense DAL972]|eukprot:XP_011779390.1 hypothetical protein, unlikely [Trypanosoma brucei gambiense DAL972]
MGAEKKKKTVCICARVRSVFKKHLSWKVTHNIILVLLSDVVVNKLLHHVCFFFFGGGGGGGGGRFAFFFSPFPSLFLCHRCCCVSACLCKWCGHSNVEQMYPRHFFLFCSSRYLRLFLSLYVYNGLTFQLNRIVNSILSLRLRKVFIYFCK